MSFRIRFTEEAQADLERLYGFLLDASDDWAAAERALDAITRGLDLLRVSPFSARKARDDMPRLRELVIGSAGYVALFEIEDDSTVTVLAVRHQREDDLT